MMALSYEKFIGNLINEIHRHFMKPFIIECGIIHNCLQALVYLLSSMWLPPVKIYTITYQESPGGSCIDKLQVAYLQPFDLEGPALNLLFNSMISSKYSNSLKANCS